MATLKTQSIGEWFGDAHQWASEGLDKFIEQRVARAIEEGQYQMLNENAEPEDVKHFMLREAIYLLHGMMTSIEHNPNAGLDAVRKASVEVQGRSQLIPPFRDLMADFLGVPNPFRPEQVVVEAPEPKPEEPQA